MRVQNDVIKVELVNLLHELLAVRLGNVLQVRVLDVICEEEVVLTEARLAQMFAMVRKESVSQGRKRALITT